MKKNILFVINNLRCGGAEKALISLLESIDYQRFNVDLLVFKHEGIFFAKIPKEVCLLDEPTFYKYFDMPIKQALFECMKKGRIDIALSRVIAGLIFKTEKNKAEKNQKAWKYISRSLNRLTRQYDAAIGFLEMAPIYFVVDKVDSAQKIGWIHTDYTNSGMDPKRDRPYFEQLRRIITVSKECEASLHTHFPHLTKKISVIENIISPKTIEKLSETAVSNEISFNPKGTKYNIVTLARLCHVKGIDLAIGACKLLVENGCHVKWYILGTGTETEIQEYNKMIREHGLENDFILLGLKDNPYPYIKNADIYVQPSRFEGKSIAIEEAKILQKPIVVTNFSTVNDQITNRETGLVVDMDPAAICEGIRELLENKALQQQFQAALSKEKLGTESEVLKVYKLFAY